MFGIEATGNEFDTYDTTISPGAARGPQIRLARRDASGVARFSDFPAIEHAWPRIPDGWGVKQHRVAVDYVLQTLSKLDQVRIFLTTNDRISNKLPN
jgi:hypothetical protein